MNAEKYAEYLDGLSNCEKLESKGKFESAEFEDPNLIQSWHAGIVKILDGTEMDSIEIKQFSDMLSCFDSVGFYMISDDAVELSLVKHIYQEET